MQCTFMTDRSPFFQGPMSSPTHSLFYRGLHLYVFWAVFNLWKWTPQMTVDVHGCFVYCKSTQKSYLFDTLFFLQKFTKSKAFKRSESRLLCIYAQLNVPRHYTVHCFGAKRLSICLKLFNSITLSFMMIFFTGTGCSGKVVFFHKSLHPLYHC